jgi:Type IV pilin-like G and H, putative
MRLTTIAGSIAVLIAVTATLPAQADPADLKTQKIEGRQMTGTLVRTQQAYYLEESAFAKTIEAMARQDNRLKSLSYRYQMTTFTQAKQPAVMILGRPTKRGLPTYVGLVRIVDLGNQETTSMAIVCESTRAAAIYISPGSLPKPQADGMPTCPTGFFNVIR